MGNETYNLVKHDADEDITVAPSTLDGKKIGVLDSAMADVLQAYLEEHEVQAEIVLFRDYEPLFDAFDNHDIVTLWPRRETEHTDGLTQSFYMRLMLQTIIFALRNHAWSC